MVPYRWFMCRFLLYIDLRSGSRVDWEWIDPQRSGSGSTWKNQSTLHHWLLVRLGPASSITRWHQYSGPWTLQMEPLRGCWSVGGTRWELPRVGVHFFSVLFSDRRLDAVRKEAERRGAVPRYDNRCRSLSAAAVDEKKRLGQPHCIRFKVRSRQ